MVELDFRGVSYKFGGSKHVLRRFREVPQEEVSLAPREVDFIIHFADLSLAVGCQCVFKGPILK